MRLVWLLAMTVWGAAGATQAVYILPFTSAPHSREAEVYWGVGLQSVLEHMLAADGDLEVNWAWFQYKTVFPKAADLDRYLSGAAGEPEAVAKLDLRWVVRGRMLSAERVAISIEDRTTGSRVKGRIAVDYPGLVRFRWGFVRLLERAGGPAVHGIPEKMFWKEDLSPRALALFGRGSARYEFENFATTDFEEGLKLGPHSYVLADSLGYQEFQKKHNAEAAKLFETALQWNNAGVDALEGQLTLAARANQIAEARKASADVARVRGQAAEAPEVIAHLGMAFSCRTQFAAAGSILQGGLDKAANAAPRERIGRALGTCYAIHGDSLRGSDPAGAIPFYEKALGLQREFKNRDGEGLTLMSLGFSYFAMNRYNEAIEWLDKARAVEEELKNLRDVEQLLEDIGFAHTKINQNDAAAKCYEQAVSVAREMKDRTREARASSSLAMLNRTMGRFSEAVPWYENALAIYRELKDRANEQTALESIGLTRIRLGQNTAAMQALEPAAAIAHELKDRAAEARILQSLGFACLMEKRYREVIGWDEKALPILRELKNRADEAVTLSRMGFAYHMLDDDQASVRSYQLGLIVTREMHNRKGEAGALRDIGFTFWVDRQYKEAIGWLEKALPIERELKDRAMEADTLFRLAISHQGLEEQKEAILWYDRAVAVQRELKDRGSEAESLYGRGICKSRTKQYDGALVDFAEAREISRELHNRAGEARALMASGDTDVESGQHAKAIESYGQALEIRREIKDRDGEASILERLGYDYRLQKSYEDAIGAYQQALAIRRERKDRAHEAGDIDSIARVYDERGERQKAIAGYEEALGIWREVRDHQNESVVLRRIGDVYNKLGQYAKALTYYEQTVTARQDQKIDAKARVRTAENDFELANHVNPAVLVLPFAVGKGLGESDRMIGVGLQYVLEGALNEQPDVQILFLTQTVRRGFKDAGQWNAYLKGEQAAPRFEDFACVVSGQVERQADGYRLEMAIQHEDGGVDRASAAVDFPELRQLRTRFMEELGKAKCGPVSVAPGALWREALSVEAANAMGRSRAANVALGLTGQPAAAADLDEAVRLAPRSFTAAANQGYGYTALGRYAEAAAVEEQAAALARETKKPVGEVLSLVNGCVTYGGAKENEKATEACERALRVAQELKNPDAESLGLMTLGTLDSDQGKYEEGVAHFERALSISRETGNQFVLGRSLIGLSDAYAGLKRYESAAAYARQTAEFARQTKDRLTERQYLYKLGAYYYYLAQFAKSSEGYRESLAISREVGDRQLESQTFFGLGDTDFNAGQWESCVDDYEHAAALGRELKNGDAELLALLGLGLCHDGMSEWEKAIGYYRQSLEIARGRKERVAEGTVLVKIGIAERMLNELSKAYETLGQALAIAREQQNAKLEGDALDALGAFDVQVGENERGASHYEQALAMHRQHKEREAEAITLHDLGSLYLLMKDTAKAKEDLAKSLAIAVAQRNRRLEALDLVDIGKLSQQANKYEEAAGYFEQARLAAHEGGDARGEMAALSSLGFANIFLKRYEASEDDFERALAMARTTKVALGEADVLSGLMFLWKERGQPRLAIIAGKEAINRLQQTRADLNTIDAGMTQSFTRQREPIYRVLAELLAAQGRLAEAQQVLDMLKEEELASFVQRAKEFSSVQAQASLTPQEEAWEKRYREIADGLTATGVRRGALLAKSDRSAGDEQELAKLEGDLEVGNRVFKAFLDSMEAASRDSKGAEEVNKVRDAESLMETLRDLGPGTVAVYTVAGEQGFRSILITPDVQKGYYSPIPAAELNQKILAFREAVRTPTRDPLPLARELYDLLVKPMEKDLEGAQARTIMWSLDGALRYVPIAALNDGKKYMVERYCNVVFTPASQSRLKDAVSRQWRGLGLGVSLAHEGFAPLPNVPKELHSIILDDADPGVVPGIVKLDGDFTKDVLRSELRKHYTMVHLASHFDFVPGTDKNSFLLLGDGSKLTLDEFRSMPQVLQGVELLTLSACDTAVGGEGADGKEVEGFAVLAQRQGAKAVVATLWSVADESTTLLMREFYRRMSEGGVTKAEALRQAQVALLTGKVKGDDSGSRGVTARAAESGRFVVDARRPYGHPYFWAPFLLMGNWK